METHSEANKSGYCECHKLIFRLRFQAFPFRKATFLVTSNKDYNLLVVHNEKGHELWTPCLFSWVTPHPPYLNQKCHNNFNNNFGTGNSSLTKKIAASENKWVKSVLKKLTRDWYENCVTYISTVRQNSVENTGNFLYQKSRFPWQN